MNELVPTALTEGEVIFNRQNIYLPEIEAVCLSVLAAQQPMASDLQFLSSIIEVFTELERMGDFAKGIARINLMIGEEKLITTLTDVHKMASITTDMLERAILAFIHADADAARTIPKDDDQSMNSS